MCSAWLIDECLQTEPSKRITFNDIVSHLLPNMSRDFHSVSYYCTSHQCPADEADSASVCVKNSVSSSSDGDEALAVNDDMITTDSADSDDDCEKHTQTSVASSWQPPPPPPFCAAIDSCNITVSSALLTYRRLPAAC